VVIGAGVAGLTCAYRLHQHGLRCAVYEASDRVGGRTRTLRGYFAGGQIVEQGGEAIDTDQQGYIGGAVRTGERAAREVIAR
jgi:monoamine oxidase